MKLIDVYEQYEVACVVLYRLLQEREAWQNISHKELPAWEQHCAFVARRPYLAWYLVADGDTAVGAVYLTKQREVGVAILRAHRGAGYASEALRELMRLHPGRFLANINPANEPSIALFRKLGFGPQPIQHTYELEAA